MARSLASAHDEQDEDNDEGYSNARPFLTTIAALIGIGVATYLTLAHYFSAVTLVCNTNAAINCEKVTTSPQSVVFGIPVAVLGLAYFVPMLVICLPWAWRSSNRLVAPARLVMATIGIGFVCYLVFVELFEVHAICLWCTSVHLLTFIIFAAVVTGWDQANAPRQQALWGESH